MIATDYERGLPPDIVARCADTDSAHGATASGANALAAENPARSLDELASDMRRTRRSWMARQTKLARQARALGVAS